MYKIKNCGLKIKNYDEFPSNVSYFKKSKEIPFIKKINEISTETIDNIIKTDDELLFYENILFPGLLIKN